MKNPPWTRDELILALNLYFESKFWEPSSDRTGVNDLSELLQLLPTYPINIQTEHFRNPDGVYMKLSNFLSIDPNYKGVGLSRYGKLDKVIWDEFSCDLPRLKRVAEAIKGSYKDIPSPSDLNEVVIDEDEEFTEGRVLTQLHKRRERNPTLIKKKKEKVLQDNGTLACEVCGFDFFKVYGELGKGFAECHHKVIPVADYDGNQKTSLKDLVIVCANCHRMFHRSKSWMTIEELREIVGRLWRS